jgi:hypothetical protein
MRCKEPRLKRSVLKHDDSDLAIYKTMGDGVPDTAMSSAGLLFRELLQVVSCFVRATK